MIKHSSGTTRTNAVRQDDIPRCLRQTPKQTKPQSKFQSFSSTLKNASSTLLNAYTNTIKSIKTTVSNFFSFNTHLKKANSNHYNKEDGFDFSSHTSKAPSRKTKSKSQPDLWISKPLDEEDYLRPTWSGFQPRKNDSPTLNLIAQARQNRAEAASSQTNFSSVHDLMETRAAAKAEKPASGFSNEDGFGFTVNTSKVTPGKAKTKAESQPDLWISKPLDEDDYLRPTWSSFQPRKNDSPTLNLIAQARQNRIEAASSQVNFNSVHDLMEMRAAAEAEKSASEYVKADNFATIFNTRK